MSRDQAFRDAIIAELSDSGYHERYRAGISTALAIHDCIYGAEPTEKEVEIAHSDYMRGFRDGKNFAMIGKLRGK